MSSRCLVDYNYLLNYFKVSPPEADFFGYFCLLKHNFEKENIELTVTFSKFYPPEADFWGYFLLLKHHEKENIIIDGYIFKNLPAGPDTTQCHFASCV